MTRSLKRQGTVLCLTNILNTNHTFAINNNPLRYRGYVYDKETGFYYLQSRYYDPVTCRFINADGQLNTDSFNGFNMFAYCGNNPVMSYDPTGTHPLGETCGDPTCAMCNSERREFINNNLDWYNRVTGSNVLGVTDLGLFVCGSDSNPQHKDGYVFIQDSRNNSDNPNIKIWNSYLVTDDTVIASVVDFLLEYDKQHPTKYSWCRSKDSLITEWKLHNSFSYIPILSNSARHADLDRDDEVLFYIAYIFRSSMQYRLSNYIVDYNGDKPGGLLIPC